jgi:NADH:quinone reductase (non-electrogenic)
VIGLIHDIPTCAELVSRIDKEAEAALRGKLALLKPESKL